MSIVLLCVSLSVSAQPLHRYESEIFSDYVLARDITYGEAISVTGSKVDLLLDLYTPSPADTAGNRPAVIFIHGGGFQDGDKVSNYGTRVCTSLAKRGYVVASINYRLSPRSYLNSDTAYFLALYRAVQDGKRSVRFLRRHAKQYRIDTTRIFATGSSAGSKTALHMAFLEQHEVPSFVDTSQLGTLEETASDPGHASSIQGVVNCWGAIWDFRWINAGDVPVFCIHGVADSTVPYDSSTSFHGFKYGSTIINARAVDKGVPTGLRLFNNTGHTLDNNAAKQDSAIQAFSGWLYTILTVQDRR